MGDDYQLVIRSLDVRYHILSNQSLTIVSAIVKVLRLFCDSDMVINYLYPVYQGIKASGLEELSWWPNTPEDASQ
jgi:hypothetical protein